MLTVTAQIRAESVANLREHWAKRAKRTKAHRMTAFACLRSVGMPPVLGTPLLVRLTRVAPRQLDGDNAVSSLKATRDGVADWLGCADNDPRVNWAYAQERGKPNEYAVRIEVFTCDAHQ